MNNKITDLTGKVFGELEVLYFDKSENGFSYWICKCSCGKVVSKRGTYLSFGKVKTCGETYHQNQRKVDEDYFKYIDTPRKAFWLGFLCADGNIHNIRNETYNLRISQKERFLLDQFNNDICSDYPIREIIPSEFNERYGREKSYILTITNGRFCQNLLSAGKTLYKHDLKEIPLSVPQEFVMDFIRGYFEGDGTIFFVRETQRWNLSFSGNYYFLESVALFLEENVTRRRSGGFSKDKSIYSLKYSVKDTPVIMEAMYYDKHCIGIKINKYRQQYG